MIHAGAVWFLHLAEPGGPGSLVWLAAGVVGLSSGYAGRAPWLGSVGTPESAVHAGPGSLAVGINLVNDVLVYD
jgi:hypothetical protein